MRLSKNFLLEELLVSSTADLHGIENTPTAAHLANMEKYLAPGLEEVRVVCGNRPIAVTSAYRNPKINKLVGGTPTSAHPMGFAADLRVAGLSSLQTARLIAAAMIAGKFKTRIDQMILESSRTIVHVSFDPRGRCMRGHQPGPAGTKIIWNFS